MILVMILSTAFIKSIYLSKYWKPSAGKITVDQNEIEKAELPLDPRNKNVSNFYYTYTFFGDVKEIKNVDGGKQIVLGTNNKDLPNFIVTEKNTKVYIARKNNEWVLTKDLNLKPGKKISISTSYEPVKKEWLTRSVYITE